MGSAAEEFSTIAGKLAFFAVSFQRIEAGSVVGEFGFESLYALAGFFLFGGVELFFGYFRIVVYGAGEGEEGGGYLAWRRG
jgi:hypothetical protein